MRGLWQAVRESNPDITRKQCHYKPAKKCDSNPRKYCYKVYKKVRRAKV